MGCCHRKCCLCILSLLCIIYAIGIQRMHVYEASQASCCTVSAIFHLLHCVFMLKRQIPIYFSNHHNGGHNRMKSVQLLAFEDTMNFLKFGRNTNSELPENENVWLNIHNYACNAMQCLVPIPTETVIEKETVTIHDSDRNTDMSVNILWIYGSSNIDNSTHAPTIIYIHGGGYVLCGHSHLGFVSRLSIATQTRIVFIQYEKPPTVLIPTQVQQITGVYQYLTGDMNMNIAANDITFVGDSAGGGLILLSYFRLFSSSQIPITPQKGVDVDVANGLALLSPWIDLSMDTYSWQNYDQYDCVLDFGWVHRCSMMAVGYNTSNLQHPSYSALETIKEIVRNGNADKMHSSSPSHSTLLPKNVYILVSAHEALFTDSENLNQLVSDDTAVTNLNFDVEHHRPHVWILFLDIYPEANISFQKLVSVIKEWQNKSTNYN